MQRDETLKLLRERIVAFAASRSMGEMAEDLAQEVLVVLHEKYPSVCELTELVPLAFKILRYKMGEARRKAMRRGEYNLVSIEDVLLADPGEDQAGELLRKERLERLSRAVAERRTVQMRYYSASRGRVARREVDPYHLGSPLAPCTSSSAARA